MTDEVSFLNGSTRGLNNGRGCSLGVTKLERPENKKILFEE
jgi:hypothetical protein